MTKQNKGRKLFAVSASAALVASAIVPVASANADFTDASKINSWAKEAVEFFVENEVINGYEDDSFKPQGNVTRAEAATMFAKGFELDTEEESGLTDVDGHWAEAAINAVAGAGIVNGYEDGSFKPENKLSRAEAAKMIVEALGFDEEADVANYTDVTGHWAEEHIALAVGAGVLNGKSDSVMDPDAPVTREDFAAMLYRAFDAAGLIDTNDDLADALEALEQAVEAVAAFDEVTAENAEEVQAALDALNAAIEAVEELDAENEALEAAKELAADTQAALDALDEETTPDAAIVSVTAINPTTIKVIFSEALTAEQAAKENFSLSTGTIENVTVSGKEALISVAGLTYGSTTTVTVGDPAYTATVTIPEVAEIYNLEITTDAPNDTIKSDGATKTQITVTLKDRETGEVVDRDGIVQFQATDGGLGQTTSALVDGKATVQLTSVASATSLTSILTATVSDVPGAQEFKGLTAQKAIIFSPEAVDAGQVQFVQPVSAESTQGDRLFVTFSDKISAAEYKKVVTTKTGANAWAASRSWGLVIDGRYVNVKDVLNKTDNTLEFILNVDTADLNRIENFGSWKGTGTNAAPELAVTGGNYLRDNAEHTIAFPNNVGSLVLANTTGIKFIKTDTSRPAVYGVTAKDQLNFEVRYTESVKHDVAESAVNYLIDGKQVEVTTTTASSATINAAKAANKILVTKIENGVYNATTAKDERNVVKFELHPEFALANGAHTIQIANILDYAGDVDPVQNKLETDTFDFNVVADTSKPLASIEVQSPEQWLVSYDKLVYNTSGKTAKDVFKVKTGNSTDSELVYGTDFTVYQVDKDGVSGKEILPTDTISGGQFFLIEFKKDWTEIYNTKANTSKTYYASTQNPYTVTLENVRSIVGNTADKQDLKVTLTYDGVSPKLVTATDVYTLEDKRYLEAAGSESTPVTVSGREVLVTFNEPIKVNSDGLQAAEGDTVSQVQNDVTANDIPASTYEFVKGDKVVKAEVVEGSIAHNDKSFVLRPVGGEQLDAGEWTVNIRSLTDDIGNAIATEHFTVTIVPTQQAVTDTQIAWVGFDDAATTGVTSSDSAGHRAVPNVGLTDFDAIYVKFTKEMNPNGSNGVSRTQNYVFMGQALPIGSKVQRGIAGVTDNWDGVTILVPAGTWNGTNDDYSVALNIASNFTSADGEVLSGAYEVELFDGNSDAKLSSKLEAVYAQNNAILVNGTSKAAVLSATAKATTGDLAKIDTIELTTNVTFTPATDYAILVNGQTFVYSAGSGTTASPLVFKAKSASNYVDGTSTANLRVTNTNGAILVNAGSVIDAAAPVISKAIYNNGKLTVTFSEAVYTDTNLTSLVNTNQGFFTLAGSSAGALEVASNNTFVLTPATGTTVTVNTSTVSVNGTLYDAKGNTASTSAVTVK